MPKRDLIPVAKVEEIKAAIIDGDKQHEIADRFQISQATVSSIRRGTKYPEVPWPNGQSGSITEAYKRGEISRSNEQGWSEAALEFMKWPIVAQQGMLEAVNAVRLASGLDPIPEVAIEWELYSTYQGDDLDPLSEQRRHDAAISAESKRRGLIFVEFNAIVESRLDEKREDLVEELIAMVVPQSGPTDEPSNELDPDVYETLELKQILKADPRNPLLREIVLRKDAALLEAMCLAYSQIPQTQWRVAERTVRDIAEQVKVSPNSLAAGEEKLRRYITSGGKKKQGS